MALIYLFVLYLILLIIIYLRMAVPTTINVHEESRRAENDPLKMFYEYLHFEAIVDGYFDMLGKEINMLKKIMVDSGIARNNDFSDPPYDSESDAE